MDIFLWQEHVQSLTVKIHKIVCIGLHIAENILSIEFV